jgi:dynein intermediate chain 1
MTTKKKAFVKVGSKKSGVSKKQIDGVSENGAPANEALKTDTVESNGATVLLSEKELNQPIDRILEATNPNAPHNLVRFSYSEQCYKFEHSVDHTAFHLVEDGTMMLSTEKTEAEPSTKPLRNQFNFSERATQTFNQPIRERSVVSEPPPSKEFSANANQWAIYDAYMEYFENQKKINAKAATSSQKKGESKGEREEQKRDKSKINHEILYSESMRRAAKLMERMVNQNSHDEILQDFKFWDDESDPYRKPAGSLLPLWSFNSEKAGKRQVTSICWNPKYHDLFAVGYGSYDFTKQRSGVICCYTLKNPSYPEYTFTTEAGVMCLDFHPKHPSLLAVGLYDGTCMIFDLRQKENRPLIFSTVKTGKHSDVVWQVCWENESLNNSLSFFSISSDGRVTNWTLSKNELQYTDAMQLKLEYSLIGLAGGTCFDFNKKHEQIFVVGTEEGKIFECSKAYNSQYLQTYDGHSMTVYSIKWNPFHPEVFLSCSADWTVKLWHRDYKKQLMSFDLGSSVGDVAWAPYSSTTFAAVTDDGKVHVFDLSIVKHDSLCHQSVIKKAKLTHVAFNPSEKIILVSDDKGLTQTLKLSPNLRVITPIMTSEDSAQPTQAHGAPNNAFKKLENEEELRIETEIKKLNEVLDIAKRTNDIL